VITARRRRPHFQRSRIIMLDTVIRYGKDEWPAFQPITKAWIKQAYDETRKADRTARNA
jgi:hypothetical protein